MTDNPFQNRLFVMDQDISIMFICRNGELLTKENTRASLSTMYNRKQLPKNLADIADDIWQERAKNNQKLYNGTKFRIDSVTESADRCTIFNIGITCYRDYIGTNWSPKAKTILELGRQEGKNAATHTRTCPMHWVWVHLLKPLIIL